MTNLIDNYHIIRELGKGGMGTVYLANDKRLDRKVAIKMLQITGNFDISQKSEIIARFEKEAKSLAKLTHPNIVSIHDFGEDNGQHFMVMEFIEGKSIGKILDEGGSIPIQQCVDFSIQICQALSYVHKNAIVHRDIKPDNIIILNDKIVKLTDFGIAYNEEDQLRLTQDGAILGSVMYISPEQLKNSKGVDNRADIYSYGVTLYQMLTSRLPYEGETVGEVVSKILSDTPELPRKYNPSIPAELEAIVMKSINKDKDKRYKTMEDMERDLKNLFATHSFKKTTINFKEIPNFENDGENTVKKKNTTSKLRSTAIIIEKADTKEKALRVLLKIGVSIGIAHLCFFVIPDFIVSSSASSFVMEKLNGNVIQGPYSRDLLNSALKLKTILYASILTFIALLGMASVTPIESKGNYKNNRPTAEVLPIIIAMTISILYAFVFLGKSNAYNEFESTYKKDTETTLTDIETILAQKGRVSYSEINDYKNKFRYLVKKYQNPKLYYDDAPTQVKESIVESDYIKLNYIPNSNDNNPVILTIKDLMENVFMFNSPAKENYLSKVNSLIASTSDNAISKMPEDAKYEVNKDSYSGKVTDIVFEWEKSKLIINPTSINLKVEQAEYLYPKKSDKLTNFTVENLSDKEAYLILFSKNGATIKTSIGSQKKEELKVREGQEYLATLLFKDKTALPMYSNLVFSNGDLIKIDKIYYETPEYYSLLMKNYPDNKEEKLSKVSLKEEKVFFTSDADINNFKLVTQRK